MGKALKTLIYDGQVSLTLMDTTDIVQQAIDFHKLSPLSAAALGRTLTACTFMATGLKNDGDKLSVTVKPIPSRAALVYSLVSMILLQLSI